MKRDIENKFPPLTTDPRLLPRVQLILTKSEHDREFGSSTEELNHLRLIDSILRAGQLAVLNMVRLLQSESTDSVTNSYRHRTAGVLLMITGPSRTVTVRELGDPAYPDREKQDQAESWRLNCHLNKSVLKLILSLETPRNQQLRKSINSALSAGNNRYLDIIDQLLAP